MKVHHIEAAGRHDGRHAVFRGGFEARRPGREEAADQFVRPLGRGHVQHPCRQARFNQRFHRPSPTPVA